MRDGGEPNVRFETERVARKLGMTETRRVTFAGLPHILFAVSKSGGKD